MYQIWILPFLQVSASPAPESYILSEIAKQGIVVLIISLGSYFVIRYLANELKKEKEKNALLQTEVKTLYEVQSKEYKAQLEILARNADIMKQNRTRLDAGQGNSEELMELLKKAKHYFERHDNTG